MGSYYENTWRTYASFSMIGDDLNPDDVSSILQVQPSDSFRRGDKKKNGSTWKHGFWSLESEGNVHSDDLSEHIEWLLDQIEHCQDYITGLSTSNISARIFCYWELKSGNGGPRFSPALLSRLVALDLTLDIDFYCDCD